MDHPDLDDLWDFGDPAGSEQRFRTLLESVPASDPAPYRIEVLTQLARSLGLQRRFVEGHEVLDEAVELITEPMKRAMVRCLLERGRLFNSSGDKGSAHTLFTEAWGLSRSIGEDSLAVDAAHMVAIVEVPERQMQWNLSALAIAESSEDPKAQRWRGSLYNNIGWTYHAARQFDRAFSSFEKALVFRKEQGNPSTIQVAQWCVARCLRSLKRFEEALEMQEGLLVEGTPTPYVWEELAECYAALGRSQDASIYATKAYEEMTRDGWLDAVPPERLGRLKEISTVTVQ